MAHRDKNRAKEYRREYYLKNKEKEKAYTKKWQAENRQLLSAFNKRYRDNAYKLILKLKDNPCMDCGNKFHPCAMDFDHVKGEKIFSLNTMYSEIKVLEEVAKCELVCANCHRVRTYNRNKNK